MTWDVAVAGTFHHDDLSTPAGRRDVLGGSAVYFALAASRLAPVRVNGIVGTDTVADFTEILDVPGVSLDGMVVSPTPTFRWHAVHDFERWVTVSEELEPGCDPEWAPHLPSSSVDAQVLFVASMNPTLQRAVLDQSEAQLIGINSMTEFIEGRRAEVFSLVARADVLFLTESELASLTGTDEWRGSAERLCGTGRLRAVVVKHGPRGAACVTRTGITAMEAVPVTAVVDPTGAGDALAGGFLGRAAQAERDDEAIFESALAEGMACAAEAIVEFGTDGLRGTRTV